MRVLLAFGGISAEREISIESAGFVRDALRSAGHEVIDLEIGASGEWLGCGGVELSLDAVSRPWRLLEARTGRAIPMDVVFPVLHGPFGEDGTIQGLCEIAGWHYAGTGVMTSALAMDKLACRKMLEGAGFPLAQWTSCVGRMTGEERAAVLDMGLPVFVKPSRLGSSVGISRASTPEELDAAVSLALGYDERIVIEKEVSEAREIEVSVLGDGASVSSSVPGEVLPGRQWYDYEAKYACAGSRLVIPAALDPGLTARVRSLAEGAFDLIGGIRGFARVDFLLSAGDSRLFLSEINTIPGFTSISMFPKLWEASGVPAEQLMDRILAEAVGRPGRGQRRERSACQ
ncbi:D-alanine--D-alanine ligase [Candidatus Fermentibacterales bacterium]|nr:D-alanine--D-alanine ligase [Candidatus Fermentibacterales bacterium]